MPVRLSVPSPRQGLGVQNRWRILQFRIERQRQELPQVWSRSSQLPSMPVGRVQAELEAILGARVDLVPASDLKPAVRARVEPELVAL